MSIKQLQFAKFDHETSVLSDHENDVFRGFFFSFEKLNINALFLLTIKFCIYKFLKKSRGIDIFSVNQMENNDTFGNKESAVYRMLTVITLDDISQITKDLLN